MPLLPTANSTQGSDPLTANRRTSRFAGFQCWLVLLRRSTCRTGPTSGPTTDSSKDLPELKPCLRFIQPEQLSGPAESSEPCSRILTRPVVPVVSSIFPARGAVTGAVFTLMIYSTGCVEFGGVHDSTPASLEITGGLVAGESICNESANDVQIWCNKCSRNIRE